MYNVESAAINTKFRLLQACVVVFVAMWHSLSVLVADVLYREEALLLVSKRAIAHVR